MAVHVSGTPIDLTDIQTEFGGVAPIGLSEYYRSGAYVTSNNTGIPTTGAISLSQFYGATGQLSFNISTSTNSGLNLRTAAVAAGWDGVTPVVLTVTPSTWIHRTLTIDGSWPNGVSLINSGKITGTGGGGGGAGQPAITIATTDAVSITNSSGAYIAGGGGGMLISTSPTREYDAHDDDHEARLLLVNLGNRFFLKSVFLVIQVEIGEV